MRSGYRCVFLLVVSAGASSAETMLVNTEIKDFLWSRVKLWNACLRELPPLPFPSLYSVFEGSVRKNNLRYCIHSKESSIAYL